MGDFTPPMESDLEKTIKFYKDKLKRSPKNPTLWFKLGNTYYVLKEYKKAVEAYEQAISCGGDWAEIFGNLGTTLLEMGQPKEAMKYLMKAVQLSPQERVQFLVNLAIAKEQEGLVEEAYQYLSELLDEYPRNHLILYNLGLICLKLEKNKEAVEHLRNASEIRPKDAFTWYEYACALVRNNLLDEGKEAIKQAVILNPTLATFALEDEDLEPIRDVLQGY